MTGWRYDTQLHKAALMLVWIVDKWKLLATKKRRGDILVSPMVWRQTSMRWQNCNSWENWRNCQDLAGCTTVFQVGHLVHKLYMIVICHRLLDLVRRLLILYSSAFVKDWLQEIFLIYTVIVYSCGKSWGENSWVQVQELLFWLVA